MDPAELARRRELNYEEQNKFLVEKYGRREVRPEPAEGYNEFVKTLAKAWFESGRSAYSVISLYSMYETLAMLSDCTDVILSEKILKVRGCSDAASLDAERALIKAATGEVLEDFSIKFGLARF